MIANTYVVKPFGISEVKVIALKGEPGGPTQEQVNTAVEEYMDDHPEAQIPDGAVTDAKLATTGVKSELHDIRVGADGTTYASAGDAVRGQIGDINDTLQKVIDVADYRKDVVINNVPSFTVGAVAQNGTVLPSYTTFNYTQKIAVQKGDVVESIKSSNDKAAMRWVTAYSGNTVDNDSGSSADKKTYTVPEGIDGVIITVRVSDSVNNIRVTRQVTDSSAYIKRIPMGYMSASGAMIDGQRITLPYHNVKIKNRYVFNANITTFSSIKFGKGNDQSITIDGTNLVVKNDQTTFTVAHGLTIGNNISLIVKNETSQNASLIRIASDGQEYTYATEIRFIMDTGTPYVDSIGSTLTDCRFSWASENVDAPIWLFGDSYFSWYDSRWTNYLARDGYIKACLLNGYAGQASADAYNALVNLLNITTPKMVVWCLGMNDGDTSSAVNASWYSIYQKVIQLKNKYGFELVLYTVPTTPNINNSYKDAIIKASGYRYIDADSAVRIDSAGHWVDGALSSDNVHPTVIGAKILYYKILADLPELMCGC